MKRYSIDKSSILLFIILGIFAGGVVLLAYSLRNNAVERAMKTDRIVNIAVIIDHGGKPASTQLFMFYPANGRGALLDVPGETGLIIKSLNRVDRIDVLYDRSHPQAYVKEIASLLDTEIPYWIILDESELVRVTDLLDGLQLFIPSAVDQVGPPAVHLPSGALVLDGDKTAQFAFYRDSSDTEADAAARRQKLIQALFRRIGEDSSWLIRPDVFPVFRSAIRSNLSSDSLRMLIPQLSNLDTDRIVMQRVTGSPKMVDGKLLLFPHYDGELVRDIVKQTLNALANSASNASEQSIFTIEVLNGTPSNGLAKRAAEIYQSFGYDVISIGNADRDDYEKSSVVAHLSSTDEAKTVGKVIRCSNVSVQAVAENDTSASDADFTIILGKDFNGRYCSH
ncbi:MAG TPA: LCP family protein [Rectinemataceae bacterium]|nr:LCP family protein [Rectinemataceae bacterium]